MPVSSATRQQVAELLPGEQIDYVIPAVAPGHAPPNIIGVAAALLLRQPTIGNMILAVTRKSIFVFSTGFFGRYHPRTMVARYPRRTRLGPVQQHGLPFFTLGGVVYEVDDEYVPVVNAVDAEAGDDTALPEDPLPDL